MRDIKKKNQEKFDNYIFKETHKKDITNRYSIIDFKNIHTGHMISEKLPLLKATNINETAFYGLGISQYNQLKKDYGIHWEDMERIKDQIKNESL